MSLFLEVYGSCVVSQGVKARSIGTEQVWRRFGSAGLHVEPEVRTPRGESTFPTYICRSFLKCTQIIVSVQSYYERRWARDVWDLCVEELREHATVTALGFFSLKSWKASPRCKENTSRAFHRVFFRRNEPACVEFVGQCSTMIGSFECPRVMKNNSTYDTRRTHLI